MQSNKKTCDTKCLHYRDEKWCSHSLAIATFKGKVDDYIIQIASIDLSLNKIASSHININNGKKCLPRKRVKCVKGGKQCSSGPLKPYCCKMASSFIPATRNSTNENHASLLLPCTSIEKSMMLPISTSCTSRESSNTPCNASPLSSLVPTDSPVKTILLRCTSISLSSYHH